MITEVKELRVEEPVPGYSFRTFQAVVQDGKIKELGTLEKGCSWNTERLQAYISFLEQVIEAIKQTAP